ncbi:MAG TPA: hypothetical protein VNL16_00365 [Chloroflexota bacterium]|nr:hypothetical protein [Chloroflexota bacterium]
MKGTLAIRLVSLFATLAMTFANFGPVLAAPAASTEASGDPRFFSQTNFRIDNDKFWDYFQKRGGVNNFGYPVSRTFTFMGKTVQFFQRRVLEIESNGDVGQMNILDSSLMPYTKINGATFPATDPNLIKTAPAVGTPNYANAVVAWIRKVAPNSFGGLPVNYFNTFYNTVTLAIAFPNGGGGPGYIPLLDLEMWGLPLSGPAQDPANHNFVYQRFQRGVMHYDNSNHTTQGLLLADYLKSIITGNNLPADLAGEAQSSPLFKQYNNSKPNGLNNPATLPNTNLSNAFESQAPVASGPPSAPPTTTSGLRYGFQANVYATDQQRLLNLTKGAGFGWIKQQIRWSDLEQSKGNINWGMLDGFANIAHANGVDVLFSVVTSPTWARSDGKVDGPPNNLNDLGDFLAALASRYDGKVQAYEIWNEQNFSREWGGGTINAGSYVELLKVAYHRIKAVDPHIIVISGALTPTGYNDPNIAIDDSIYLGQMEQYQGGVFKTVADAVGAHMAGFNNAPQDWVNYHTVNTPGYKNDGSFYFRRIDQLHGIMAKYGDNRQMWLTEYEWGAATPPVPAGYEWTTDLTEAQVGDFLVQSIQMIRQSRPWVGAVFIWNLNFRVCCGDPHTSETALFGILNADWTPRSIYNKLAAMPK